MTDPRLEIRQVKEFSEIGGVQRAPGSGEDLLNVYWDNASGKFKYRVDSTVESAEREEGGDALVITLTDGTVFTVDLGALAWEDEATVDFPVTSVFGRTGDVVAEPGDYTAAQVTNAFDKTADDLDDIDEGVTNKHFTATDEANLDLNTAARHTHSNKPILDLITDAGGGVIPSTAEITAWNDYLQNYPEYMMDLIAGMIQNGGGLDISYNDGADTLTFTVDFSGLTTDDLPEGTTNLYASENAVESYTLYLDASSDVATRIASLVEGTDYPTGWVLSVDAGVNLVVAPDISKKLISISVFEIDTVERIAKPFSDAFSGYFQDGDDITIEGLDTLAVPLRIEILMR